ncbi:unnamed protein product [Meloidogyne enterolobii]|uniref:Uncharacterized protein n=1 Tax=Meloidogyne enterolobii TaxID=390850 RepID=A0ACB0XUR9_MELEN
MRKKTKIFKIKNFFLNFFTYRLADALHCGTSSSEIWMIFQNAFFQVDVQLWQHGMVWSGWCDLGAFSCGWWKNMLLNGGRTCFEWWKNMIWGLSTAVWWTGRICYWVVEGIWAAVGWWKNMPLNGGRTCIGWWKKMLLVVAEDAHFGCKFAMI